MFYNYNGDTNIHQFVIVGEAKTITHNQLAVSEADFHGFVFPLGKDGKNPNWDTCFSLTVTASSNLG